MTNNIPTVQQERPSPRHFVVVTTEQSILMDVWGQYAYERTNKDGKIIGYWNGGLSVLESIESYLLEHHLMSKRGNLYKRIEI